MAETSLIDLIGNYATAQDESELVVPQGLATDIVSYLESPQLRKNSVANFLRSGSSVEQVTKNISYAMIGLSNESVGRSQLNDLEEIVPSAHVLQTQFDNVAHGYAFRRRGAIFGGIAATILGVIGIAASIVIPGQDSGYVWPVHMPKYLDVGLVVVGGLSAIIGANVAIDAYTKPDASHDDLNQFYHDIKLIDSVLQNVYTQTQ